MIKARACKNVSQEWSPRVTFHALGSVEECEEMNPHTPKWALILGVKVLMDFWIFKGWLQGPKLIGLKSPLYYRKTLIMWMSKMGLHDPFGYFKHKLWPKERPGIKLPIWLLTTKSQELPWFTYVQVACHIHWKAFHEGYNFASILTSIRGFHKKLWGLQSHGSPNFGNFETSNLGVPGQNDIWVLAPWPDTKNNIRGKVVASPKFGP
jgi:hypothetical protein